MDLPGRKNNLYKIPVSGLETGIIDKETVYPDKGVLCHEAVAAGDFQMNYCYGPSLKFDYRKPYTSVQLDKPFETMLYEKVVYKDIVPLLLILLLIFGIFYYFT